MQIILRAMLFAAIVLHPSIHRAQCTIFNPAVKLNRTISNTLSATCDINLDLYFDMQANAGGKYVYVHIWPKKKYPSLIYNNPPTPTELTDAVATLGFYHFGSTLYMLNTYTPYPSITNYKYAGISIVKSTGSISGSNRFTIQNILITGPAGCAVAQDFTADVWQSQSASAQNVHCFSKGLNFYANDPKVTGSMLCGPPRQYQFKVNTIEQTGLQVSYKVQIDNGDGIFNASDDSILVGDGNSVVLDSSNSYTYNSGIKSYLPYSNQKPEADRALWVIINSPSRDNAAYARIDNICFLLPVELSRFEVYQANGKAILDWTTLSEIDNNGFEIERKDESDASDFRSIGFLPSQSVNGNSQSELNYRFIDPTPLGSSVQYRIKQVDHSGKFSYSPIRYLNIRKMLERVQPNPANTELTLMLSDRSSTYRIEWISATGQKLGSWNTKGMLTIPTAQFPNGTHLIQITDPNSGRTESKKILIQHMQ